jgi:hypothetical protein
MNDSATQATSAEGHFAIIATGLVCTSVCTDLSDEAATNRLNMEIPTGINRWAISTDPAFAGGEPNPSPCPLFEGARHILFDC